MYRTYCCVLRGTEVLPEVLGTGIEVLPEVGFPVKDFSISGPFLWLLCKHFAQLCHAILRVEVEEAQVDLQRGKFQTRLASFKQNWRIAESMLHDCRLQTANFLFVVTMKARIAE